jgi:hypothetical protein
VVERVQVQEPQLFAHPPPRRRGAQRAPHGEQAEAVQQRIRQQRRAGALDQRLGLFLLGRILPAKRVRDLRELVGQRGDGRAVPGSIVARPAFGGFSLHRATRRLRAEPRRVFFELPHPLRRQPLSADELCRAQRRA